VSDLCSAKVSEKKQQKENKMYSHTTSRRW